MRAIIAVEIFLIIDRQRLLPDLGLERFRSGPTVAGLVPSSAIAAFAIAAFSTARLGPAMRQNEQRVRRRKLVCTMEMTAGSHPATEWHRVR